MTTRAQAKAAARPTRARKASTSTSATTGEKENKVTPAKSKVNGTTARAGPKEKKTKGKEKSRYCLCKGDNDGTPMVWCSVCKDWYHFRCVDLIEEEADNIKWYVCPPCTEKTGRRTVMKGEGPEALEPDEDISKVSVNGLSPKETTPVVPKAEESEESEGEKPEPAEVSESSGDGTEDEYVDESEQPKPHSKKSMGKRPTRRVAVSDSESDGGSDTKTASTSRPRQPSVSVAQKSKSSTRIMSVSPPPSPLKRKPSSAAPPPPKRRRSESTATDDPTRKYCHGKLAEMFVKIFLNNPRFEPADGDGMLVEKKPEELSDEDKNILQEKAKAFAAELEQCLFDTYADPDKHGRHVASTKYKERFRMITFNLPQADRAHLHKQIVNGELTPAKISVMSSTDLASEEIQQSIKAAEEEALQHSILQKSTLPRAKITHKGLQDIEDPNEEMTRQREREIARELEEEEQERREKEREKERERERLARLKPVLPQPSLGSASVPPESPVTPHAPVSWGAPPPVPTQAVQGEAPFMAGRPPIHVHPLFEPSAPEMQPPLEHEELNLGDLIHIDEEPSGEAHEEPKNEPLEPRLPTPVLEEEPKLPSESPEAVQPSKSLSPTLSRSPTAPEPSPVSTTGISPFAAGVPSTASRASFDLNALWSGPTFKPEPSPTERVPSPQEPAHVDMEMHVEPVTGGAADQDFDMFLRGEEEETKIEPTVAPPTPEEVYAGLPHVWSGILSMPLDSTIPQETHVYARQIGGRSLEPDSPLWRTLLPSETLRIDGRVAVNNSSQYLLQARMNSARELIAVTFSPESEPDKHKFGQLLDFLIHKDRHGLIFPWGNRGREWGRELYVIPLLSTYPLPDYIELLDDLRLPKERKENCLVGMWVLTRGKLSPPPQHAPHPTPPVPPGLSHDGGAQQAPPLPFNMPDIAGLSQSLMSGLGGPPPSGPPTGPPAISPASLPLPSSIAQNISPALAAEVASLTPEQVQIMLQTLRSTLGPNISIPSTPVHPGPSSASPYRPPQPPPQPPFPQAQPPMPWPQFAPTMPLPIPQPPPLGLPQHERYEERPRYREEQGERGFRGRGRARGGRGRGRGRDEGQSSDVGWRGRGGRRGGGGGGDASPDRYPRREKGAYWS